MIAFQSICLKLLLSGGRCAQARHSNQRSYTLCCTQYCIVMVVRSGDYNRVSGLLYWEFSSPSTHRYPHRFTIGLRVLISNPSNSYTTHTTTSRASFQLQKKIYNGDIITILIITNRYSTVQDTGSPKSSPQSTSPDIYPWRNTTKPGGLLGYRFNPYIHSKIPPHIEASADDAAEL
jgi:hypothetical protein